MLLCSPVGLSETSTSLLPDGNKSFLSVWDSEPSLPGLSCSACCGCSLSETSWGNTANSVPFISLCSTIWRRCCLLLHSICQLEWQPHKTRRTPLVISPLFVTIVSHFGVYGFIFVKIQQVLEAQIMPRIDLGFFAFLFFLSLYICKFAVTLTSMALLFSWANVRRWQPMPHRRYSGGWIRFYSHFSEVLNYFDTVTKPLDWGSRESSS